MKNLLLILLVLAPLAIVLADFRSVIARKKAGAGACDTLNIDYSGTVTDTFGVNGTTEYYYATFVSSGDVSAHTVCRIDVMFDVTGSPTGNIYASIYTHDATPDDPGTMVGDESDGIDVSTITGPDEWVSFTGLTATLSGSTDYWVVVRVDTINASNYLSLQGWNRTGGDDEIRRSGITGPTWTDVTSFRTWMFRTYSE